MSRLEVPTATTIGAYPAMTPRNVKRRRSSATVRGGVDPKHGVSHKDLLYTWLGLRISLAQTS